jgi:hypothetical protein
MAANGNGNAGNAKSSGFSVGATAAVAALGATVATAGKAAEVGATAALKTVEIAGQAVNATAKVTMATVNLAGTVGAEAATTTKNVSVAALKASSAVSQQALQTSSELTGAALKASSVAGTEAAKQAGDTAAKAAEQAGVVTRVALEQGAAVSIEGLKGAAQVTLQTTKVASQIATNAIKGFGYLADLASETGGNMVANMRRRIEAQKQANTKTTGLRNKEVLMITFVNQFNEEARVLYNAKKAELESNENSLQTILAILKDNYCVSKWKRVKSKFSSSVACPSKEQRTMTIPKLFQYMKLYKMNSNALLQTIDREQKKAVSAMQFEGKRMPENTPQNAKLLEEQEYQQFLDIFNQKMAEFANNIASAQSKTTNTFEMLRKNFETLQERSTLGTFNSNNVLNKMAQPQTAGRRKTYKKKRQSKKTHKRKH